MAKLIALYKQPPDTEAFEQAYFGIHLPLIAQVPGLKSTKVTRFQRTLMGDGYYLMAEMAFESMDSLKGGLRSPEMATAGENLNTFAAGLVSLLIGEENP